MVRTLLLVNGGVQVYEVREYPPDEQFKCRVSPSVAVMLCERDDTFRGGLSVCREKKRCNDENIFNNCPNKIYSPD